VEATIVFGRTRQIRKTIANSTAFRDLSRWVAWPIAFSTNLYLSTSTSTKLDVIEGCARLIPGITPGRRSLPQLPWAGQHLGECDCQTLSS
jgi:hypothetical protein